MCQVWCYLCRKICLCLLRVSVVHPPRPWDNLKACAKGLAPKGFPGWPLSRLQSNENVVVENTESQVNHFWKTCNPERRRQEDLSDSTSCESDDSYPDTGVSGSSSSDKGLG